ncbi:MAG: single-stranded DNA-binding protein [Gemmatimonadales bacterium]|jgi:single-strand DNA-binding protein
MARSINRVILVGNAGSDPDVRETSGGTPVAHLSLATDRFFRQNGEEQRKTDWHRLTFWGKACEIAARFVQRGSRLYVEGRIEYGSYERDGVTIPTTDIIVQEFVMLDGANAASLVPTDEQEVPALL